ncbi:MAG TPA: ABC-F family ATP-binding cassette domain-containing protein, partial [Tissierellaceae bacterium]
SLASVLINDSDLLILDEPTNHLDNDSIDYLEEYLLDYKGAILMVTHDRYFLDRVSNRIIELDNKQIYSYSGNYNYFLTKKMEREEKDIASERKRKSLYRQELEWMKQGVKARGTRQKARVERFNDLKNSKLDINEDEIEINVGGKRLGKKIVEVKNISKNFGDKEIIRDFSYTVLRDDRIGIVGDNGSGKTTLMNIITGYTKPTSGMVDIGETVKIGYFSQEVKGMDENLRAIEYIKEGGEFIQTSTGDKITATDMMELFLFDSNEQYSVINKLSGGERRRLFLLRVLMEGPNFLILDEPTNDLDIQTITILEEYIESFPGPVIVVSHDRYFLDKITNSTFHIEDAQVNMYPGNYSYYKKMHISNCNVEDEKPKNKEEVDRNTLQDNKNRTLKFSYNEKREFETIDLEIKKLEEDIEKIEKEIELNAANYVKLEELLVEKEQLEENLEFKMERWLYLTELNEEIESK